MIPENRVFAAQRNLQQTVDLLMDVDRLLASHPLYRLEEWVEFARNSGTTLQEKDAYEANAKRLITSWGWYSGRLCCPFLERAD